MRGLSRSVARYNMAVECEPPVAMQGDLMERRLSRGALALFVVSVACYRGKRQPTVVWRNSDKVVLERMNERGCW